MKEGTLKFPPLLMHSQLRKMNILRNCERRKYEFSYY